LQQTPKVAPCEISSVFHKETLALYDSNASFISRA